MSALSYPPPKLLSEFPFAVQEKPDESISPVGVVFRKASGDTGKEVRKATGGET